MTDCRAFRAGIAEVTRTAFAERYGTGDSEATLIDALRADGDVVVELAAVDGEDVVGHAMFSRAAPGYIAGLAPVSARIGRQGQGIGSALIRAGLQACTERGIGAVIVLGEPEYYGRFGFSVALAAPLACAFAGPHFQAMELEPGALAGVRAVEYARAFKALG
ncbi:MAG TPA: N-acetyltransferase [Rhizomicrobium sp.]|nr:N-acetyltransferase [Rhizomicrobium sp.]